MQFSKNENTVLPNISNMRIYLSLRILAWILMLGLFSSIVITSTAYAQDGGKGRKRTAINFEDELVEGQVQKPELMYLLQKKQFNFKRLIKLRQNFLPEMRRTAEDIQPVGSEN